MAKQLEVVNCYLEQYLRAFTQDKPHTWVSLLSWAEFHYNINYHSELKMSPFQALYGRAPPTILQYTRGSTSTQVLNEALTTSKELLCTLKSNLLAAQNRMTMRAKTRRWELSFDVGDMVLVHLQPYHQLFVTQGRHHKLCKHYYGPYPKRIG